MSDGESIEELRRRVQEREELIANLSAIAPRLEDEVRVEQSRTRELASELEQIGHQGTIAQLWEFVASQLISWKGCLLAVVTFTMLVFVGHEPNSEIRHEIPYASDDFIGAVMMHAEGGPPLGAMCKSQIYRLSQSLPNHATSCAVSIACDDEAKGDWKYESKLPCWLKTRRYPCGEDNEDTCFFYKTIAGDKDPAKRPFFRYDEHRKKITFINEQGGRSELFLFDAGGER